MRPKIIISVVIQRDGRILMVREGKEHCRGQWNFPSGRLDYGEKLTDGIVREAKEETGYDIKIKGLVGIYNYMSKKKSHCLNFSFIGKIVGGKESYDGQEIIGIRWIPIEEIEKMDYDELRSPIIQEIIKDFKSGKSYPIDFVQDLIKVESHD